MFVLSLFCEIHIHYMSCPVEELKSLVYVICIEIEYDFKRRGGLHPPKIGGGQKKVRG